MVRVDNVLCLTDFSEDSSHALTYARTLAELFNTKLIVMHVIANPTNAIYGEVKGDYLMMEKNASEKSRQMMTGYDAQLRDYPNHQLLIKTGEVVPIVLETVKAEKIGTIVVGSHGQGHHALRHLMLGSTADKLLRSVPCPVLVVRHPNRKNAV